VRSGHWPAQHNVTTYKSGVLLVYTMHMPDSYVLRTPDNPGVLAKSMRVSPVASVSDWYALSMALLSSWWLRVDTFIVGDDEP